MRYRTEGSKRWRRDQPPLHRLLQVTPPDWERRQLAALAERVTNHVPTRIERHGYDVLWAAPADGATARFCLQSESCCGIMDGMARARHRRYSPYRGASTSYAGQKGT